MLNKYYKVKFLFNTTTVDEPHESTERKIELNKLIIIDSNDVNKLEAEAGLKVVEFLVNNYTTIITNYGETEYEGFIHVHSDDPEIHHRPLKFMISEIETEEITSFNEEHRAKIAKTLGHMAHMNMLDEVVKLNTFLDLRSYMPTFSVISSSDFVETYLEPVRKYPGYEEVEEEEEHEYQISCSAEVCFKVIVKAKNEDEAYERVEDAVNHDFTYDVSIDPWEADFNMEVVDEYLNEDDIDLFDIYQIG